MNRNLLVRERTVYSADVGSEFRKSRGTGFRKVAAACHEQLFS